MSRIQALWKTLRPINLLTMALTMIGVYGAIVHQFEGVNSNHFLFGILILAIVLLGAGGNLINDIEDIEVDAINKPGENEIGVSISRSWAMNWYFILTLSGILLGLIVSAFQGDIILFALILFIAMSLWFYSRWMQRQLLIGNFVVALLCAILPVLAFLFLRTPIEVLSETLNKEALFIAFMSADGIVVFYTSLAFLITFVREYAKDIEDVEGDSTHGYKTLPIFLSQLWRTRLTSIMIISIICVIYFLKPGWTMTFGRQGLSPTLLLTIIIVPILISLFLSLNMNSPSDAGRVSKWLKITMAVGVATTGLFWFL